MLACWYFRSAKIKAYLVKLLQNSNDNNFNVTDNIFIVSDIDLSISLSFEKMKIRTKMFHPWVRYYKTFYDPNLLMLHSTVGSWPSPQTRLERPTRRNATLLRRTLCKSFMTSVHWSCLFDRMFMSKANVPDPHPALTGHGGKRRGWEGRVGFSWKFEIGSLMDL